ncbi:MAG TPA: hypothetical protein VMD48_02050 [Solirubrobacteraceae bacterium]|nr:hypothetical protein [Solirubrobacteraceae bacterium]
MPRQNRVTPRGELIAVPARGLVYANRGCLHDDEGRIRRHHNGQRWIACRLSFRGWHRSPLMAPGRFTELFFLDEATAFAAGHRPCALCRREDYNRFLELCDVRGADQIDQQLHFERWQDGQQRLHESKFGALPDGAFVLDDDGSARLVSGSRLLLWTPNGYTAPVARPFGHTAATVITPPTFVEVLSAGWEGVVPLLHPSEFTCGS